MIMTVHFLREGQVFKEKRERPCETWAHVSHQPRDRGSLGGTPLSCHSRIILCVTPPGSASADLGGGHALPGQWWVPENATPKYAYGLFWAKGCWKPADAGKAVESACKGNFHLLRKLTFVESVSLSYTRKRRTLNNSYRWGKRQLKSV